MGQNNFQQPSGYSAPGFYHNTRATHTTSPISLSVPALATLLQPSPSNTRPKQDALLVAKFKLHWQVMDGEKDKKSAFSFYLSITHMALQAIQTQSLALRKNHDGKTTDAEHATGHLLLKRTGPGVGTAAS